MALTATKPFRTRVGRVRFKNGGEIRALPDTNAKRAAGLHEELKGFADLVRKDQGSKFAGFAIVAWASDTTTTTDIIVMEGCPLIKTNVPDAARNALQRYLWRRDMAD